MNAEVSADIQLSLPSDAAAPVWVCAGHRTTLKYYFLILRRSKFG